MTSLKRNKVHDKDDIGKIRIMTERVTESIKALDSVQCSSSTEEQQKRQLVQNYSRELENALTQIPASEQTQIYKLTSDEKRAMEFEASLLDGRQDDVNRIHDAMVQIKGLMQEASTTTKAQGDVLDRLDYHMTQTDENTKKGLEQLYSADEKQRNKKRSLWVGVAIGLALVVSLLIVIAIIKG
jgi:t-SNARE complex subunit (syntaxin)